MDEKIESFMKAKKIYEEVRKFSENFLKENEKILKIAEEIENKIRELGGKPAFPVNISINEIAAHYTPSLDDKTNLKNGDLVKVDIGVSVEGWIYDGAFSVLIGRKDSNLIEAAKKAVEEGVKASKAGTKISEISEAIESVVKEFGVNTIRNLSGHRLDKFELHAEPSIPNVKNNINIILEEGWIIAIEVFTTNGSGWVKDSRPILIFQYLQDLSLIHI